MAPLVDKIFEKVKEKVRQTAKDRSLGLFDKLKGLAYGLTLGLLKEYQEKTAQLIKMQAATFYLKGVQLMHRQILGLAALVFILTVLAVAVVMVPIALVALSPWTATTKMVVIAGLGILDVALSLWIISQMLSEEKWLEITKSNEIIERLRSGE